MIRSKLSQIFQSRYAQLAAVVVVFGILGSIAAYVSHAATPTASIEAEQGAVTSPATIGSDSNASGGKFVQFSSGTTVNNGAKLLWSDEFNGPAGSDVNGTDWQTQVGAPTNLGRVEYDTPGTTNKQLDGNGNLVITARRQAYNSRGYTSARIEGTHPVTTGYVEYRAKYPVWPGLMPSTWLYNACGANFPTSLCYQPDYAEIDFPEIVTGATSQEPADPTNARLTIHSTFSHDHCDCNLWQRGWNYNKYNFAPQRVGDAWHRFGTYINPTDHSVTFYVDGAPFVTYGAAETKAYLATQAYYNYQSDAVWPFGTQPLIPIIEIEMGGYSGTPDGSTNSDTLQVDYYRVYDKPPY